MQDTELTKILTEQTKAETKAFKAKRKAEHIDKILSSLSDKEEREAHARLNKSLEDTEILPGETEEMMAQKFQKKLSIYNRASKSNDFYEDDITALIQDLSDSIETFETCYPNSEFVARYRKRIKEIVASKQSKDKKERIYVVIFIIILVVSTIYYYYTDITNFFKNLL